MEALRYITGGIALFGALLSIAMSIYASNMNTALFFSVIGVLYILELRVIGSGQIWKQRREENGA